MASPTDELLQDERKRSMTRRKLTAFEKFAAALLCKGDLSEENLDDAAPCSTLDLFRFANERQKWRFALGILVAFLSGFLMPLNTLYSGMVAKAYLESSETHIGNVTVYESVLNVIWFYAVSASLLFLSTAAQQFLLLSTTDELADRLRREYLSAVLRTPAAALDAAQPGAMAAILTDNINKIRDGLGEKIALVVRSIGMFVIAISLSMFHNWKVTLCLIPLGPISAMITGLMGRYSAPSMKKQMRSANKAAAIVEESIMHVRTVSASNGQADMVKKYSTCLSEGIPSGARVNVINGFFEGAFFFAIYAFAVLAVIIGVIDAHEGGAAKGSVVIAFALVTLASFYMGLYGPHIMALLKARIAAAVIYKTIDECAPSPASNIQLVRELRGEIVFEDVRFKYASRDVEVLKGLTFTVQPGQTVALAGKSGCGKSTTAAVLARTYSPAAGKITIDGLRIDEYDTTALRQALGVVSQEPILFSGSIRENITLSRVYSPPDWEGSIDDRIDQVLRVAQAYDFVKKLEKGVETLIGPGGVSLSGGQKQRIAIARALFTDPSILILDEATSALDVHLETKLQKALTDFRAGRTTIVIAHRLSTLKSADCIYVMEDGMVVEQGSHEQLLALDGGIYARMVAKQSLTVKWEKREDDDDVVFKKTSTLKSGTMASTRSATAERSLSSKRISSRSSFARIYTHGHYAEMLGAVLFSILRGMEMICYVVVAAYMYESLDAPSTAYTRPLTIFSVSSVLMGAAVWASLTAANYFTGLCSERVLAKIRTSILDRVLHQEAEYFDDQRTSHATIVNDLNQQSGALIAGLDYRFLVFVWCSTSFIACLSTALWNQWQIGLYALALALVFFSILLGLFILMTKLTERVSRDDRSAEIALEVFEQTRTIQTLAVEPHFERKYALAQQLVSGTRRKVFLVQSLTAGLNQCAIFVFGALAFGTGASFVFDGALTAHALFVVGISVEFVGCALSIINPFFPDLVRANAAARILYAYFDLPKNDEEKEKEVRLSGAFAVENVQFAYPARRYHEILRGMSISAAEGDAIALVGPSGCGKSTLISLLERFYCQQQGFIKFDGIDHHSLALTSLRNQIALVAQEPVLFEGTISENIALGCPDCTLDEVRAACATANAAAFIEALPEGYETTLSSMGRSLSGGQKQRIAIARALVRKPKLLLLDEATSALDGESEKVVQEALSHASEGRTTLSIAHRISTIKDSTRIYFLDNGSIAESGSHEELIRADGKYAAFVKAQSLE